MNSVSSDDEEMKRVIELSLLENKNVAGCSQDFQSLNGASADSSSDTSNISSPGIYYFIILIFKVHTNQLYTYNVEVFI